MFCKYCGMQVNEFDNFCNSCGCNLNEKTSHIAFNIPPKPVYKKAWFWIIISLAALSIINFFLTAMLIFKAMPNLSTYFEDSYKNSFYEEFFNEYNDYYLD